PVIHNLVISNVPGPAVPLYFLGARMTAMYPFGPIFHGAALNITVLSLDGRLDIGLISCPDLVPDLWELVDDFSPALEDLILAAGAEIDEILASDAERDDVVSEERGRRPEGSSRDVERVRACPPIGRSGQERNCTRGRHR